MRLSLLAFTVVAIVGSTMTAASAFNFATVSRTIDATIVSDNGNAYIAVQTEDANYACLVEFTNGEVHVGFDGGTSCAGTLGTGVGPDSTYIFTDVVKITNKGAKALTGLWLNTTDSVIQVKTGTSAGAMAATATGFTSTATPGALAIGSSIWVGFKIDTTGLHTGSTQPSKTLTIEARATN